MALGSFKPKWTARVNAEISRAIPSDGDSGRVAAMFGLQGGFTETLYEAFEVEIAAGQIVAVLGPSGAGKSVLLRQIVKQVPDAISLPVGSLARSALPAVGILRGGSLRERLEILSRCGLAEATALITPARDLSGGQLHRLALAKALHTARRRGKPALVVADEFAATLDAVTARALCRQIRKLATGWPVALLVAMARTDLLEALQPDQLIVKPLGEPARRVKFAADACSEARIGALDWQRRIARGSIGDYDALSSFHYLAGRPAAHKRVYFIRSLALRGRRAVGGEPRIAAVLVISPPLANVRGRNIATGGRYAGPDRATAMALLNAEMECISRVVVHPVFRGCGLAVRLVRHAIATAQTPLIEALAAMGAIHPFFEKAGMTAYPLGPDKHISRFISAAEAVGLGKEDLPAVEPVKKLLSRKRRKHARFLKEELDLCLRRTFSAGRLLRLEDPVGELCRRTARQYVYYLAKSGHSRGTLSDEPNALKESALCPKG